MWIDTGELIRLLEKLDEAQAAVSAGSVDPAAMAQWIAETRAMVYADIAQADAPADAGRR